jgi:hypothetical protein
VCLRRHANAALTGTDGTGDALAAGGVQAGQSGMEIVDVPLPMRFGAGFERSRPGQRGLQDHEATIAAWPVTTPALAGGGGNSHHRSMFVVSEIEAATIRAVFEKDGEFSAAIELRRLFPGITDTAKARIHVRMIAGWKPLPAPERASGVLHPQKISRLQRTVGNRRSHKTVKKEKP